MKRGGAPSEPTVSHTPIHRMGFLGCASSSQFSSPVTVVSCCYGRSQKRSICHNLFLFSGSSNPVLNPFGNYEEAQNPEGLPHEWRQDPASHARDYTSGLGSFQCVACICEGAIEANDDPLSHTQSLRGGEGFFGIICAARGSTTLCFAF